MASNNSVQGIKICRRAPPINHLHFVNDSVIFCKANVDSDHRVQELLHEYEQASRQKIHAEKTTMVFSHNVIENCWEETRLLWGSGYNHQYEKYFGLPLIIGRSTKKAFFEIKMKAWKKLQLWKENFYHKGVKRFLLKLLPFLFPPIPWAVSNYLRIFFQKLNL